MTEKRPQFYIVPKPDGNPKLFIAQIGKNGCSLLAQAVLMTWYPSIWALAQPLSSGTRPPWPAGQLHYPKDIWPDYALLQGKVPRTQAPSAEVYMVVRDPVQRFLSAMAFENLGTDAVDTVIGSLQSGGPLCTGFSFPAADSVHKVWPNNALLQIPGRTNSLASDTGLELPGYVVNAARNQKPTLTDAQMSTVQAYYADDMALWQGLS